MVTGGLPGERDASAGVAEERMSRCQQAGLSDAEGAGGAVMAD